MTSFGDDFQNQDTSYLVWEAGADGGLDDLVQVRVSKNQGRVFTPQLQRELLTVGGAQLRYDPSRRRGAREGDEGNLWMADQSTACFGTSAKHDVDDSWRDTCTHRHRKRRVGAQLDSCRMMGTTRPTSLLHQFAQHPGGHRGHLAGFGHHGVPSRDGRCDLPGEQVEGKIPGADESRWNTEEDANTWRRAGGPESVSAGRLSAHPLPQGSGWCSSGSPCGPSGCTRSGDGASRRQRSGSYTQRGGCPQSGQRSPFYLEGYRSKQESAELLISVCVCVSKSCLTNSTYHSRNPNKVKCDWEKERAPVKALSGTLIFGLGLGQILQVGLDQVGQLVENLSPLLRAALRPCWEGFFGCCHRRLHLPQRWLRPDSQSLIWCRARACLHSSLFHFYIALYVTLKLIESSQLVANLQVTMK